MKRQKKESAKVFVQVEKDSLKEILAPIREEMAFVEQKIEKCFEGNIPLVRESKKFVNRKGKRIRPALVILFGKLYGGKFESYCRYASVVEIIHLASLIHDDVIDNATTRRGKKSLNQILDNRRSVSIGDFFFSLALEKIAPMGKEALELFARTIREMCEGEMLELSTQFSTCKKKYLEIVDKKTGSLFAASCGYGALSAGKGDISKCLIFGRLLGKAFQIQDDALDFTGSERQLGKGVFQDVREGKVTLPLIEALKGKDGETRERIRSHFAPPVTHSKVLKVVQFVNSQRGPEKAQQIARNYIRQAHALLSAFPQNKWKGVLHDLAEFMISRKH